MPEFIRLALLPVVKTAPAVALKGLQFAKQHGYVPSWLSPYTDEAITLAQDAVDFESSPLGRLLLGDAPTDPAASATTSATTSATPTEGATA